MNKTENTENTENQETENIQKEDFKDLTGFFKLKKTNELDAMVSQYFIEKQTSPFIEVSVKDEETGELSVDIDKEFEDKIKESFGSELNDLLSDYFIGLLTSMVEDDDFKEKIVTLVENEAEQAKQAKQEDEGTDTEDDNKE